MSSYPFGTCFKNLLISPLEQQAPGVVQVPQSPQLSAQLQGGPQVNWGGAGLASPQQQQQQLALVQGELTK